MKTNSPATNHSASSSLSALVWNWVLLSFKIAPVLTAGLVLAASAHAQTLLLSDNFNSNSGGAAAFNSTLTADQGGSLATISYSVSAPGGDWSVQHGNGGSMLIANAGGNNWASLDHDFSVDANTANQPLIIQFDAWVTDGNPWCWLGFGIGPSQGTDFYSQPYGLNFTQSSGTHNYKFVISDTAGTGSAFSGVSGGAVVRLYIDGVFQSATTNTLGSGDGYLTFKQDQWDGWSIGHVDNLAISVSPAYTLDYSGNGSDSGTAPTDANSPYLAGSTVTALSNTGGLAKTGQNFAGWNTAADGTGVSYAAGSTFTIASNTVLYARWVSGYTVTYVGNGNTGGSVPVDANGYSAGASATVLGSGTLTKTGSTFTNWNLAANGSGASYNPGSSLTVNSNTTLYAQWTLNQYTATYLAVTNGAISGLATQTVFYGTSTTPVTAVPNPGYRFIGWSDGVNTLTRSDVNFSTNLTVTANFDNNLVWNNSAGTFAWNLTDTNWQGYLWNNAALDSALFNDPGAGTVTLQTNILASSLTLVAGSAYVLNGSNHTLQVLGDVAVRGTSLTLSNGVFNLNRVITSPTSGDWGILSIASGAAVTVTNGIDGSVGTPYTFALNLNGGTLTTPSIKVADLHQSWGNSYLTFNGTEVIAAGDNADFIQTYGDFGNNNSLTVGSGGAIINTAGHNLTINPSLIGTGGLIKKGAGTLDLTAAYAANTYSGSTVVSGGVLSVDSTTALGSGAVSITNGASMNLNYSGQIVIQGLTLNGVTQPNGTYGSSVSGATYTNDTYFANTGTGVLLVNAPTANQILTWTGATDNNWDEATANWTNGFAYNKWGNNSIAPNSALFDLTGISQSSVNVALGTTFYASNVTFNAAGYTIGGGALTLGNSPVLTVNSNATISSVLQGSGGLTKTGNAKLTLTGANNTFAGPLTVAAGTLEIGGSGNFEQNTTGGAVTVSNGATILVTSAGNNALPFQSTTPAWTVAGTINVTGGTPNTIPGAGVVLNNGTLTGTPANLSFGTYLAVQSANNIITANGSANAISSDNFAVSQTLTLNTPLSGDALVASSGFFDGFAGAGSLAKSGLGTVTLSGINTYSGSTAVSAGTLMVNGSIATGATVSGGTLAGSGTIGGAVTVNAGGSLAAGAALNGIGTLTVNNNLTLNGNVLVNLKKGQAQSNSVFTVSGVLTNANGAATTLTVANLGPTLAVGDKFKIFSQAVAGGATATIVPPSGYTFSNDLAADGSITVASTPAPPVLGYTHSGNSLIFTWSGAATLQAQTNTLNNGLGTNWVDYSSTSGVSVPINTANGSVFFRLKQ